MRYARIVVLLQHVFIPSYFCDWATFASTCLTVVMLLCACREEKVPVETPWGTTLGADSLASSDNFLLDDIVRNGELIVLTMRGPQTYYDYRGRGMGLQYLLCEKFAHSLGVSLRVDLCKDTAEMVNKLKQGDGDIIAFPLPIQKNVLVSAGPTTDSRENKVGSAERQ